MTQIFRAAREKGHWTLASNGLHKVVAPQVGLEPGSASYEKSLALTQQEPERPFLQERIRQLKEKHQKRRLILR